MNCNREEAIRAKDLAKGRFLEKRYNLAKKLALKARNMWLEIEGISNFLDVVNVFISSNVKVGGTTDWYHVLGVDPTCDENVIKQRFRRIPLSVHPDKNHSIGSTEAFKIVSTTYEVLSDRKKRSEYDAERQNPHVKSTVVLTIGPY